MEKGRGRDRDRGDRGGRDRGGDRDRGGEYRDRGDFDRGDRDWDRGGDGDGKKMGGGFSRKKVCRFCADRDVPLTYKLPQVIQVYVSEHGKLVPRRVSGNCAVHQRRLTMEIKRARQLALISYLSNN